MASNIREMFHAGLLTALVVSGLWVAGCNGEDINSLPEANRASVFGNPDPFPDMQNWSPDYVVGEPFAVSHPGGISAIGMWTPQAGCPAQLAVYADSAGLPGALVANTAPFTTVAGANVYPPTGPAAIPAGTYWITFHFGGGGCNISSDDTQSVVAQYLFLPFGSALPDPMPATTTYSHVALNLFVVVP